MPKDLPSSLKQDSIQPYSGGAWLWLTEIVIPTKNTQRIARNTEDVVYADDRFTKGNFDLGGMTFSSDGSIPRITLRVAQDRAKALHDAVEQTYGALGGTVKIIKAGEKFLDEAIPALEYNNEILGAETDDAYVTLTLGIPNPLSQQVPLRSYCATSCPFATPDLFKGPECGYSGVDTSCTGTYQDCYEKGNAVRWGGDIGLDPNGMSL